MWWWTWRAASSGEESFIKQPAATSTKGAIAIQLVRKLNAEEIHLSNICDGFRSNICFPMAALATTVKNQLRHAWGISLNTTNLFHLCFGAAVVISATQPPHKTDRTTIDICSNTTLAKKSVAVVEVLAIVSHSWWQRRKRGRWRSKKGTIPVPCI